MLFPSMLESLPNRKEKLEMADILQCARAISGQMVQRNIRVAVQDLRRRPGESNIRRRVDAVCKIGANRPHRSPKTNSEADRLDHVVEILRIVLVETERYIVQA